MAFSVTFAFATLFAFAFAMFCLSDLGPADDFLGAPPGEGDVHAPPPATHQEQQEAGEADDVASKALMVGGRAIRRNLADA